MEERKMSFHDAAEAVAIANFKRAREMLCIKMGWETEYSHHILRHDVDGGYQAHQAFIRKVTRLLSFNYDTHRRPNPALYPQLWPKSHPGNQPVKFPPEWNSEEI